MSSSSYLILTNLLHPSFLFIYNQLTSFLECNSSYIVINLFCDPNFSVNLLYSLIKGREYLTMDTALICIPLIMFLRLSSFTYFRCPSKVTFTSLHSTSLNLFLIFLDTYSFFRCTHWWAAQLLPLFFICFVHHWLYSFLSFKLFLSEFLYIIYF